MIMLVLCCLCILDIYISMSMSKTIYLELRNDLPFSTLKYDNAIIAPLSAMQLPVNRITGLYLPTP
jgi:hypothetical protein